MELKLAALLHLMTLGLWGGVVATEAVLELYPRRRAELHPLTICAHYWIDLLVELPVVLGVCASGALLVYLAWPLSSWHLLKIACAAGAVGANLYCIVLVIRRQRMLTAGQPEQELWRLSRRISMSAAVGMPLAAVAAAMGFWLALQRVG